MFSATLTSFSTYTYDKNVSVGDNMFVWAIWLAVFIFMIAAMWKVFTKAKKPGWGAIIPIYDTYLTVKIAGRPGWWLILFFIPLVNIIAGVIVFNDISKAFGKGVGYTLLLIFLPIIGWPLLAWGDAKYKKPKMSK